MIRQTEVDGVPTVTTPTSGPMRAGLVFRVGTADETLARHGVTHLLEHLALHQFGLADYHYNGATGDLLTHFHTHGSARDVTAFFAGVCAALREPPIDRLDMEKSILRTEWRSRTSSVLESFPLWRHGARDYGIASYVELGLNVLGPDDVRQWSERFFTRDNAVFWVAGDSLPADLRLDLPGGRRHAVPAASSALPTTPAYFQGVPNTVGWDAVVRRGPAASLYSGVLERQLFRSLRQEGGFSYTAASTYDPRGNEWARVAALADALPEKQDAVLGGFVDVLAALRVGRIEQSDVDAVLAKRRDQNGHADVDADRLVPYAVNLLTGYPNRSVSEYLAELEAVTLADIHAVAVEAAGTALLMVPDGRSADWAGFTAAPTHSTDAVEGTWYKSLERNDRHLVVGPEGATLLGTGCAPVTVRFAETAALAIWPDGARELIGTDAISVRVEPTLFAVDQTAVELIDRMVPPDMKVTLPPRDPEAIPRPRPPEAPATGTRKRSMVESVSLVVLGLTAAFFMCCSGILTLAYQDGTAETSDWVFIAGIFCVGVVLALPTLVLLRRR